MSWIFYVILIIVILIIIIIFSAPPSKIIDDDTISDLNFIELRFLVENPRPTYGELKLLADKESSKKTTESLKKHQIKTIDKLQDIFKNVKSNGMIPEKYRESFPTTNNFHSVVRYDFLSYAKSYFDYDKNWDEAKEIIDRIDDEAFLLGKKVIGIGDTKE